MWSKNVKQYVLPVTPWTVYFQLKMELELEFPALGCNLDASVSHCFCIILPLFLLFHFNIFSKICYVNVVHKIRWSHLCIMRKSNSPSLLLLARVSYNNSKLHRDRKSCKVTYIQFCQFSPLRSYGHYHALWTKSFVNIWYDLFVLVLSRWEFEASKAVDIFLQ